MKILAMSGHKSSGKNTCANYIVGHTMLYINEVDWFKQTDKGELVVPALNNDQPVEVILDICRKDKEFIYYASRVLWPHVKLYSFADPLKEFCMNCFGLTYEQCYGNDEDKNSLTEILWENMPGYNPSRLPNCKSSYMTAREVMQYFGTEIVRKIRGNAWSSACINKILSEESELAIIVDCRFPDEVEAVQKSGGKVIRLTRSPFNDNHYSETALNNYSGFDHVIDNAKMTIPEQNEELYKILREWNWISKRDSNLPA